MTRFIIALALPLAGGCGGPDATVKQQKELRSMLVAYHDYHDTFHAGPADAEAFLEHARKMKDNNARAAIQAARRGDYVVFYGVKLSALAAPENTVLIYHKDTPAKGGPAGMADSSVRMMSADEFAKAPRAGK